jgi:ATP/maltotriose-dependent transcriptional regulator MalT
MAPCDDLAVEAAEKPDFTTGRAARPGAEGVVSRPGLFELLQMSARVTVMSAPPGSGKTVGWVVHLAAQGFEVRRQPRVADLDRHVTPPLFPQ